MAKFVTLFKYSPEGYKGLLKNKASSRDEVIRKAYAALGGTLDALYWASNGEFTGVMIGDVPDRSNSAFLPIVEASGAFASLKVIEVISSQEMDERLGKLPPYSPPSG